MGNLKKMKPWHYMLLDLIMSNPEMSQSKMAEELGHSTPQVSGVINSEVFKVEVADYRKRHEFNLGAKMETLRSKELDATCEALEASRKIIKNEKLDLPLRQESIRNILDLGHAKAVEKTATMSGSFQIPAEVIKSLTGLADEISRPLIPRGKIKKREEITVGEEQKQLSE